MKKFLILLMVLGFLGLAGFGGLMLVSNVWRSLTASVFQTLPQQSKSLKDSFSEDRDSDGLSDGKEFIFGTDPEISDTDSDGFKDGEEVQNGFDPTNSEKGARISDNPKLMGNLTVQYFLWGTEKTGIKDPQLNEKAVEEFLKEKGLDTLKFPEISDIEINKVEAGAEAVKKYLEDLANVRLPAETASYLDLAQKTIQNQRTDILGKVTAGLSEAYESFRQLKTPPEALELQKGYLASLKVLQTLFLDLYTVERDPVKLMRDVRWGNELVSKSAELERMRLDLVTKYLAPESNQNP